MFFRVLLVGFGLFRPGAARAPKTVVVKKIFSSTLVKIIT